MKKLCLAICCFFALGSYAQIPKLESYPGMPAVVYLDFDGHYVVSAAWNSGNPINCQPGVFTPAQVTEIFKRVSEDYSIFKINITTDSTKYLAAPLTQRIRIIVTTTKYFVPPGTGGIAYMNSFIWGDDTPGFVFIDANPIPKFVAEASSHEAGHSLGLAHQSVYAVDCSYSTYNAGQGSGEIGWAPIMGFSIDRMFSTWNNGECSLDCGMLQNDISIISSKINGGGLKPDDVTDVYTTAPNFTVTGGTNIRATGFINNNMDVDVFKLNVAQQSKLYLQGLPPATSGGQTYGNVDIMLKLMNASGTVIKTYNYTDSLKAKIDTTLNAGTYYIAVDGVGNVNVATDYGSVGDYELLGTLVTTASLPIYNMQLTGRVNNNDQHTLNWNIEADEPLRTIELQYSADGIRFSRLTNPATKTGSFTFNPFISGTVYYRIAAWLRDGSSKTSPVITLRSEQRKPVEVLNNQATNELLIGSTGTYRYEIYDLSGRIVNKGTLSSGLNKIPVESIRRGMYVFKGFNSSESVTERFLKL